MASLINIGLAMTAPSEFEDHRASLVRLKTEYWTSADPPTHTFETTEAEQAYKAEDYALLEFDHVDLLSDNRAAEQKYVQYCRANTPSGHTGANYPEVYDGTNSSSCPFPRAKVFDHYTHANGTHIALVDPSGWWVNQESGKQWHNEDKTTYDTQHDLCLGDTGHCEWSVYVLEQNLPADEVGGGSENLMVTPIADQERDITDGDGKWKSGEDILNNYEYRTTALVRFQGKDGFDNLSNELRFGIVLTDWHKPVLNVCGGSTETVEINSDWELCGDSTAYDEQDGEVTASIKYTVAYVWNATKWDGVATDSGKAPGGDGYYDGKGADDREHQFCCYNADLDTARGCVDGTRMGDFIVTISAHDEAEMYGEHGQDNYVLEHKAIEVVDTIGCEIELKGHSPVFLQCDKSKTGGWSEDGTDHNYVTGDQRCVDRGSSDFDDASFDYWVTDDLSNADETWVDYTTNVDYTTPTVSDDNDNLVTADYTITYTCQPTSALDALNASEPWVASAGTGANRDTASDSGPGYDRGPSCTATRTVKVEDTKNPKAEFGYNKTLNTIIWESREGDDGTHDIFDDFDEGAGWFTCEDDCETGEMKDTLEVVKAHTTPNINDDSNVATPIGTYIRRYCCNTTTYKSLEYAHQCIYRTIEVVDPEAPVLTLLNQAERDIEGNANYDIAANACSASGQTLDGKPCLFNHADSPDEENCDGTICERYESSTMNNADAVAIFDWTQQFFDDTGSAPYQYHDPGATCSDHVDGTLNHAVEITGHTVSLAQTGTYTITYNCRDLSGNSATAQTRIVQVVDSNDCTNENGGNPKILITPSKIAYEAGFIYNDYGVTAHDPKLNVAINSSHIVAHDNIVNTFNIFAGHGYTNCKQIEQRCEAVCSDLGSDRCPENDPKRLCNPGEYNVDADTTLLCFRRKNTDSFTTYQETGTYGENTCPDGYDDVTAQVTADWAGGYTNTDNFVLNNMYQQYSGFCKKTVEAASDDGFTTSSPAVPTKAEFNARLDTTDDEDKKTYTITYAVQDRDHNPQCGVNQRIVHVEDTMPPVIHIKWAGNGITPQPAEFDLRDQPEYLGTSIIDNTPHNSIANTAHRVYNNSAEVLDDEGSHISTTATAGTADNKIHSYAPTTEMAEVGHNVNGWIVAGFGVAATGLALLTYSSKKTTQIEV